MQIAGVELEDLEFDSIGSWPFVLRVGLFVLTALIAIYLGYSFYLADTLNLYNAKKNERISLQQSYALAHDQASNVEGYKKQISEVRRILDSIRQQVPRESEQAELLEALAQLAVSNGLSLLSVKPSNEEYKGFYFAQTLELYLVGDYHNFGEFIADVSAMSRLVTLNDFNIKSDPKNLKKLEITLNVEYYWTGEPKPVVKNGTNPNPQIVNPQNTNPAPPNTTPQNAATPIVTPPPASAPSTNTGGGP